MAQGRYQTKNGELKVIAVRGHNTLTVHSRELDIILDYKTAEFSITLPVHSLHSGIDTLDRRFDQYRLSDPVLRGNLGLGHINTTGHPPVNFEFRADLIYRNMKTVINGKGHLHHIEGGEEYSCMLGLQFELEPGLLGLTKTDQWVSAPLKIQVLQTILEPVP